MDNSLIKYTMFRKTNAVCLLLPLANLYLQFSDYDFHVAF